MRMYAVVMVVLGMLFSSAAAAEDISVFARSDVRSGERFDSLGFSDPSGWQMWLFNLNQARSFDIELGYGRAVHKDKDDSLLFTGYVAYFPESDQFYVEPWICYTRVEGDARLRIRAMYYFPVSGDGAENLVVDEISATWPVVPNVRLGPAWRYTDKEAQDPATGGGAIAEWKLGHPTVTLRYTGGDVPVLRLQIAGTICF